MTLFFLAKPKLKEKRTSSFINFLPKDGIMADGGLAYFLAYQTYKRVVIIPHHETNDDIYQTLLAISEFDLNYAVISDEYKKLYKPGTYPALDFIELFFKEITSIQEDGDVYHIYQVPEVLKDDEGEISAKDNCMLCRPGKPCPDKPLSFLGLCWN